jgi:CubicO group peptidase (beta-lactamase class C family)
VLKDLDKELKRQIRKHKVPGASVAVLRGKRIVARSAAGVVNKNTQVKTTTDTLFQIGSITKPMTATMIMQLRDEGKLKLDDPILTYLPNFRIADMHRLRNVTIRHLLSHTSGIDGDFFPKTDSGDRAIEQLLDMSAMLPSLFKPGTNFSYSNIGFAALGRVIEVLDGRTFDRALKKRIFEPLEMNHALSLTEDNIRYRVAVGHLPSRKKPKELIVPNYNYLTFGMKSAGSTPTMTADDLLKFAAVHMQNGIGLNGAKLLSKRSTLEMRRRQWPPGRKKQNERNSRGLAWGLLDWSGEKLFAHSGSTVGQNAILIVSADKKTGIALLTNGGDVGNFKRELLTGLLKSVARITVPPIPTAVENVKIKPEELVGVYENINNKVEISEKNGKLYGANLPKSDDPPTKKTKKWPLEFESPRTAIVMSDLIEFGGPNGKRAEWIRGTRLLNRID